MNIIDRGRGGRYNQLLTDWSVNKMEKRNKKRLILKVATKIISEKGYSTATIDEITKRAGVGKGTFYLYFKDKADLFYSIIKDEFDNLIRETIKSVEGIDDFFEKIRKGIEMYLSYHQKNYFLFKILLQEKPCFKKIDFHRFWDDFFSRWGVIKEGIKQQIKECKIREMDPDDIIYSLLGILHSHIHRWILSGRRYSLADKTDTIYEIFINGIRR
ncbi:MAG: TetR/AcrR family transcriptional regulator [Candidatus Omnitrophica bacterium]|nr:TetR/AcrR family transcriptional regulator [Candidatus Omnitrophota bacterium]